MDHLWTPWRYHYISKQVASRECIFCSFIEKDRSQDQENLILARFDRSYLILNRFPYTSGHLLLVLNRHVADLCDAEPSELQELVLLAGECQAVLRDEYRPDGFNIGFNLGRCAGAGVAGHLHLHIVPRWIGDSNFVNVLSQTRLIPEDLQTTYSRLAPKLGNR